MHVEPPDFDYTRSPERLLEAITTSPCDLEFADAEHKRRFMVDVFKLENYWKEPNRRVHITPLRMYKTHGYKILKDFTRYRKIYADNLHDDFESDELALALQESIDTYTFVPLMNLLRAKMAALREQADEILSINTVARIMAILGLGNWELDSHSESYDGTI